MSLSTSRKINPLSESLIHKLNLYALGATTAGVSMLALVQSAEAKIIYTKAHVLIGSNQSYQLDLNHDGAADFKISNTRFFTDTYVAGLTVRGSNASNKIVGIKKNSWGYAYALFPRDHIGANRPFSGSQMAWIGLSGHTSGDWANVRNRYLGLKFILKGKVHYGWARLNVAAGHRKIAATLTGYAYETIPNKAIVAGKTKGPDVVTVRLGTLGSLARGISR